MKSKQQEHHLIQGSEYLWGLHIKICNFSKAVFFRQKQTFSYFFGGEN